MNSTKLPSLSVNGELIPSPSTVYADQLAQLAFGPFVSKLTFGLDVKSGEVPKPVVTVALPTAALIAMANQVLQLLAQSEVQAGLKKNVEEYLQSFPAGRQS